MTPNAFANLVLLLVVPGSIWAFAAMKPSRAVLAIFFVSVLFLPEGVKFEVPFAPPLDKHALPTLCMLVGCFFAARKQIREARVGRGLDFLVIGMVLANLGTTLTNADALKYGTTSLPGLSRSDFISTAIQLVLYYSAPFLLGRVLFRTVDDARDVLTALVVGALVYVPFVLIEIRFSPQWNAWIYGFVQHDFAQTKRSGGWRPMVFMHHGLALALYMSAAVLAAWTLVPLKRRIWIVPPRGAAVILSVLLVLLNSLGALLFGVVGGVMIWLSRPKGQMRFALILASLVAIYPLLRVADLFPAKWLVDQLSKLSTERAASLGYRFWNEDMFVEKMLERPVFGWGGWGRGLVWDQNGRLLSTLDGAWLGLLQGGFSRLVLQFGLLLAPVWLASRRLARVPANDQPLLASVAIVSIFYTADLLPNGMFNQMPLFLAGALAGLAQGMTSGRDIRSILAQVLPMLAALDASRSGQAPNWAPAGRGTGGVAR